MLSCIILILLGMLLDIVIYMLCMCKKQTVDHVSAIGSTSHAISEHSYKTIDPSVPTSNISQRGNRVHGGSLYPHTGNQKLLYYELEEDDNYSLGQTSCNCQGACNCSTYI